MVQLSCILARQQHWCQEQKKRIHRDRHRNQEAVFLVSLGSRSEFQGLDHLVNSVVLLILAKEYGNDADEQAHEKATKAITQDPNNITAHRVLALLKLISSNTDHLDAKKALEHARKLNMLEQYKNPRSYALLACTLSHNDGIQDVMPWMLRAYSILKKDGLDVDWDQRLFNKLKNGIVDVDFKLDLFFE